MRVPKYKDIVRMTLYGRHDQYFNGAGYDSSSIYPGYDRGMKTIVGGGINTLSLSTPGTAGIVKFSVIPNIFISNNENIGVGVSTLTDVSAGTVASLAITNAGTGFTSNPTLLFYGGNPTTVATATATQTTGTITAVALTNAGAGYSSIPSIGWNGGGSMNITATVVSNALTGFTITTSPTFTAAPTILLAGGGGLTQTTTCTLAAGLINAIALPTSVAYTSAPTVYILGGTGTGALIITPTLNYSFLNSISLLPTQPLPFGNFITQPTISYNGGGIINIIPTMNGGNTIITGFNIINGGYANCFTSAPTILITGGGGTYAQTTCTLTNGIITGITLPLTNGNNSFTSIPTVSVYGANLPNATATLNPYSLTIGSISKYNNVKKLRFDLNQELSTLKLADGAHLYLEYIRMPALTVNSMFFKSLRLIGGENKNIFDSSQGTSGNPILFTCEGGNNTSNYYLSDKLYSRLPISPNFLSKGYIEFELETFLMGANTIFTPQTLFELIIKLVIEEPKNEQTQDINLAPEYERPKTFNTVRTLNHRN